jgi:hypothetical protein
MVCAPAALALSFYRRPVPAAIIAMDAISDLLEWEAVEQASVRLEKDPKWPPWIPMKK